MGRGRIMSGLQAFGAGRLRRVPSVIVEQTIPEPPNPPKPPSGNEDTSNGGGVIPVIKEGVPPDISSGDKVVIVNPGGGGGAVGGGPLVATTEIFIGENGPKPPTRGGGLFEDGDPTGGGGFGGLRSLPASMPTRGIEIRNFPPPKTVVQAPSTKGISRGTIEFSGGFTNSTPTIRTVPEFSPGARVQDRNDYIKQNLLTYAVHASDMVGFTMSGTTYENNAQKYFGLLFDLFALDTEGRSKTIIRDASPQGLSADGFPVKARSLDNLEEGITQIGGSSGGNFFSQQFFRYDLTGNSGVTGLTTGDTVTNASLILTVDQHVVDRQSSPAYIGDTTSFIQGPAAVPERTFQAIKINATYDADYAHYLTGTSWGFTYGWDSFYGTSGLDVDTTKTTEFTISEPLKKGDKIKLNLTTIATDALANTKGIMRFAIRPKANAYGITGISSGSPTSNSGLGLHIFTIDRELDKPLLTLKFNPSNDSTKERLARLIRGK